MSEDNTDYIITKGTVDAQGNQSYVTKTPTKKEYEKTPQEMRQEYLNRLGVYQQFLDENPDVARVITQALKFYRETGTEWTQERFQAAYSKTNFALSRQKAEEEFDLGMGGANADTYQKKVDDSAAVLTQQAQRYGITLSPQEAQEQARIAVRSNLSQTALDAFWSAKYTSSVDPKDATKVGGKKIAGTASTIQSELQDIARAYGVKISNQMLTSKTGEALSQGQNWQEWMRGQEAVFRDQAKLLYPKAAHLLDGQKLSDVTQPYFEEAGALLGIDPSQMDITDEKWTGFLNGENGIMSKDEWLRVLKTDSKYGWDKSTAARQKFSSLGDDLLAAFGKA